MIITYTVQKHEENQKISQLLRNKFDISSRLLTKLKMNEKILVNDIPVFSSHIIHENDIITVKIDFEEKDFIEAENIDLDILFEDEYLLAINKPAGMVVHPSSYHQNNTLANGVKYYLNNNKKIRPVNRLDKDTSGIVIFAKNEYIQELMKNNHVMQKEYITIVNGILENKKGTIDQPIARKEGSIMERIVDEKGQKAVTHYEVIDESVKENLSLVHVILETGRTHQIRVHFAYIGHTILGDTLYGIETKLINRQSLHAWKLSFTHPITKEKIHITAPIPQDMKSAARGTLLFAKVNN